MKTRALGESAIALVEDIAQKILGPDWKERQEEHRATLSAKTVEQ
jgi:hypothetical protein